MGDRGRRVHRHLHAPTEPTEVAARVSLTAVEGFDPSVMDAMDSAVGTVRIGMDRLWNEFPDLPIFTYRNGGIWRIAAGAGLSVFGAGRVGRPRSGHRHPSARLRGRTGSVRAAGDRGYQLADVVRPRVETARLDDLLGDAEIAPSGRPRPGYASRAWTLTTSILEPGLGARAMPRRMVAIGSGSSRPAAGSSFGGLVAGGALPTGDAAAIGAWATSRTARPAWPPSVNGLFLTRNRSERPLLPALQRSPLSTRALIAGLA